MNPRDPQEQAKRDAARLRYERRNLRLIRVAEEKYQRQEVSKEQSASPDAVAQALARALKQNANCRKKRHEA